MTNPPEYLQSALTHNSNKFLPVHRPSVDSAAVVGGRQLTYLIGVFGLVLALIATVFSAGAGAATPIGPRSAKRVHSVAARKCQRIGRKRHCTRHQHHGGSHASHPSGGREGDSSGGGEGGGGSLPPAGTAPTPAPAPVPTTYELSEEAALQASLEEMRRQAEAIYRGNGNPTWYEVDVDSCEWGTAYTGGRSLACDGWVIEEDPFCAEHGYAYNYWHFRVIARLRTPSAPEIVTGATDVDPSYLNCH